MKLTSERHALVKLGDFGLSKILDPDSLTSGISSYTGTLSFKAPDFGITNQVKKLDITAMWIYVFCRFDLCSNATG